MSVARIVVGLDASRASWTALRWAAARAVDGPAHVRVVHALERGDADRLVVRERLAGAAALVRGTAPGAVVDTVVERGSVVPTLVGAAAVADLLVIGAHRSRTVRSALTRSLARRIATSAAVPTVVVPEDWIPGDGPIVVGLDAETSGAALAFGLHEARRTDRSLRLVHAWRVAAPIAARPIALLEDASSTEEQSARLVLAGVGREAARLEPSVPVDAALREGDAGEALAEAGAGASLVVVGRRPRTTIGAELSGSVVSRVVHRSRTPVVVVPVSAG